MSDKLTQEDVTIVSPELIEQFNALSDEEKAIINCENVKYKVIKPFYEQQKEAIQALIDKFGDDHHFQDPISGVVYRVSHPEGKYVYFNKNDIERTRFSEEKQGGLGLEEARRLGYIVEGKAAKPEKEKKE